MDSPFAQTGGSDKTAGENRWVFVTNHAMVLLCVAESADVRVRDIANMVGITERATHGILTDLDDAGFVTRRRRGRRNHYLVNRDATLRQPLVRSVTVGELLDTLRSQPSFGVAASRLVY